LHYFVANTDLRSFPTRRSSDLSIGFCVAMTKNGSSSRWRVPPMVTLCSCIASSRADCVFGVARLISSASTIWAKIGPDWKLKTRSEEHTSELQSRVDLVCSLLL